VRGTAESAAAHTPAATVLQFDDLCLDTRRRLVWRGVRPVELTPTEFSLLALLLEHPNTVLPRSYIFTRVWGFDFGATSNLLNVYIGYVRRKTEAAGEPRVIHTVRGVGYVLRASYVDSSSTSASWTRLPSGSNTSSSRI
jgi:two-component system response regulator MprA